MSALKKLIVAIIVLISTGQAALAAIGTSTSYTLDFGDTTIDAGSSSSANYVMPVSVIGDNFDGKAASANYRICAGLVEEISGDCLAPPPPPGPGLLQKPETTQEETPLQEAPQESQEPTTTQETQDPTVTPPVTTVGENQASTSNQNSTNKTIPSKPSINPTEETPINTEQPTLPSEQNIDEQPDEQNAEPSNPQNPEITGEEPPQPIYNALENPTQTKEEMHSSSENQSSGNQSVGFGGSVQIGRGSPLISITGIEQWVGQYLNTETKKETQIATIPDVDNTQSTTPMPVMVSIVIILITALLPNIVRIIRF